jgi:hypothetical protein
MRLGIMQPYLFPYLGYFQLLACVDKFVIYDDVSFIKQGWINRNRILVGGQPHLFSVPLRTASSFTRISDIEVHPELYDRWRHRLLRTVEQSYRRAPCFAPVRRLLAAVLEDFRGSIANLALRSIMATASHLDIRTAIAPSARDYGNGSLKGQDRVIDVCQKERAHEYVNLIGGRSLYAHDDFAAHGIALRFLRPRPFAYRQFADPFTPDLSIIDVMMFNPPHRVGALLREFDLVSA